MSAAQPRPATSDEAPQRQRAVTTSRNPRELMYTELVVPAARDPATMAVMRGDVFNDEPGKRDAAPAQRPTASAPPAPPAKPATPAPAPRAAPPAGPARPAPRPAPTAVARTAAKPAAPAQTAKTTTSSTTLLWAGVVVLLVGGGAYYWYTKQKKGSL
jgi:LPXTG-motif cell wall-anchored protein